MRTKLPKTQYSIRINTRCTGCGECVDICPTHVLIIKKKRVVITDSTRCIGCLACEQSCSVHAITVSKHKHI